METTFDTIEIEQTETPKIENFESATDSNFLKKFILDAGNNIDSRVEAIKKYYELEKNETLELLCVLNSIYQFSGSYNIKQFLLKIGNNKLLSDLMNLETGKYIVIYDENDEDGYLSLIQSLNMDSNDLAITYKIDVIHMLLKYKKTILQGIEFFKIFLKQNYEDKFKITQITKLEKFLTKEEMVEIYRFLSLNTKLNNIILQCYRYILRYDTNMDILKSITFTNDEDLSEYADILIKYGDEKDKEIANGILEKLAGNKFNIYENKQNVHSDEMDKNIETALRFLTNIKINKNYDTFEKVEKDLFTNGLLFVNDLNISNIKLALYRIDIDPTTYSTMNLTTKHVLLLIYSYIKNHEYSKDLEKRLLEELNDMKGTCASGYITRLINTISGFGHFEMRISWEEQFRAKMHLYLNKSIMRYPNILERSKILEEMTEKGYDKRRTFLKFFRRSAGNIIEKLRDDFKTEFENGDITETDFDLFVKKAIIDYEDDSGTSSSETKYRESTGNYQSFLFRKFRNKRRNQLIIVNTKQPTYKKRVDMDTFNIVKNQLDINDKKIIDEMTSINLCYMSSENDCTMSKDFILRVENVLYDIYLLNKSFSPKLLSSVVRCIIF